MDKQQFIPLDDLDPVRKTLCWVKSTSNQDLAKQLGWSDTKASRTVDDLVASGLVAKVRDGQAVKITLPRGTHIYELAFRPQGIRAP